MRQKVRFALVFLSFLLFPVTMFYHSPVLILQGAAFGVIAGCTLLFAGMFVASLLLGRLWCGWVCTAAGLQEACYAARTKHAAGGRWNLIKWFIWFPWMGTFIYLIATTDKPITVDPLYQTWYGISIAQPPQYIIYYFFIVLIVVLALAAGRRSFCHHVCWMSPFMILGRRIRNLAKWPALRLVSDRKRCLQCGRCSKACGMGLNVQGMVDAPTMENPECILCGACVDTCPNKTIKYSFSSGTGQANH